MTPLRVILVVVGVLLVLLALLAGWTNFPGAWAADWLDGPFSAGDLTMVSVLLRLRMSGILNEYPNLAAYVARGEARPAYKRAFDAQLAVYIASHRPAD